MKRRAFLIGLLLCLSAAGCGQEAGTESMITGQTLHAAMQTTAATQPEQTLPVETEAPEDDGTLVSVTDYIPDVAVELKYATADNFTGQVIYDFQEVYLRYGTVKKLAQVQQSLGEAGLRLKIWDGFRPVSAQYKLWEACPDPTYVANPQTGYSNHSRGNAVDVTLVDMDGNEMEMPTGFDDFSQLADRDYSDCTPEAAENAQLLQRIMEKYGFTGYFGEWWHFADSVTYPVEEDFQP